MEELTLSWSSEPSWGDFGEFGGKTLVWFPRVGNARTFPIPSQQDVVPGRTLLALREH